MHLSFQPVFTPFQTATSDERTDEDLKPVGRPVRVEQRYQISEGNFPSEVALLTIAIFQLRVKSREGVTSGTKEEPATDSRPGVEGMGNEAPVDGPGDATAA